MEGIANLIGLTASELLSVLVVAIGLIVGWVVLRVILKLTQALFRAGCLAIAVIVGVVLLLGWLN